MRTVVVLLLIPVLAFGQQNRVSFDPQPYLHSFSSVSGPSSPASSEKFETFVERLAGDQKKSDHRFLKRAFDKIHGRFLKHYKDHAGFNEVFTKGTYNCLTATALYALTLKKLGYTFQITETNYHIFIIAETSEGKVLIETTDPIAGFVTGEKEINQRIARYTSHEGFPPSTGEQVYYQYQTNLYNQVELSQLTGLLHYNEAVAHSNSNRLAMAVDHLESARKFYHSPRLEEFARIVLLQVVNSNLQATEKETLVKRIQHVRRNKTPVIASLK